MFRLFFAIALIFALVTPVPAAAELTPAGADLWRREGDRITFMRARISFPARVGAVALTGAFELSRPGQGLDSGLQYESADRQVFASVYVYAPSLAHSGLTAFATDNAVHVQSGSDLRVLGSRTLAAGGRDGVAIRLDYSGFRAGHGASSAAFLRAGLWIIKLRVSGPEPRRVEVEAAMTSLLAGMRFEGEVSPRPAEPLEVGACPARTDQPAQIVPHQSADTMEDAISDVANSTLSEPRPQRTGPDISTIFPTVWCLSSRAHVGNNSVPILRALPFSGSNRPRSVLIASLSDSATMLRLVENRDRHVFILYHHQIGRTLVLGRYGAIPTDEQIANIASGADQAGGHSRATIAYPGDGNSSITINEPVSAPSTPST